jgi:hypothetical protein
VRCNKTDLAFTKGFMLSVRQISRDVTTFQFGFPFRDPKNPLTQLIFFQEDVLQPVLTYLTFEFNKSAELFVGVHDEQPRVIAPGWLATIRFDNGSID